MWGLGDDHPDDDVLIGGRLEGARPDGRIQLSLAIVALADLHVRPHPRPAEDDGVLRPGLEPGAREAANERRLPDGNIGVGTGDRGENVDRAGRGNAAADRNELQDEVARVIRGIEDANADLTQGAGAGGRESLGDPAAVAE